MAEEGLDITKMIPSREIVDLKRLEFPLSTKEGFISAVMALGCGTLPKFFPNVPEIGNKNNDKNVVMNSEYRESQLRLPQKLYDSQTYEQNPLLRGPVEEIILAYENERILSGFEKNHIVGDGWSEHFKKRFEKLTPKIGPVESSVSSDEDEKEKLPENPKGRKVT